MAVAFSVIFGGIAGLAASALWWAFATLLGFGGPTEQQCVALAVIFAIGAPVALGVVMMIDDIHSNRRRGHQPKRGPLPPIPDLGSGVARAPARTDGGVK